MPRKSRSSSRNKKKGSSSNTEFVLFILFWAAVLIETIALYKCKYPFYIVSRMCVVPILLIRIFSSQMRKKLNVFIYIGLLASITADAFTIFGGYFPYSLDYIGLSMFSLSYLAFGCALQQFKNIHNRSYIFFIVFTILLASVNVLWIYAPEARKPVFYTQISIHIGILIFLIFATISTIKRVKLLGVNILLWATVAIIITNIIFGIDILLLNRLHPSVDGLVGLGNGVYLFLLTKGFIAEAKSEINV